MIDTTYLIAWLEHASTYSVDSSELVTKSKLKEAARALSILVVERNALKAEVSYFKELAKHD